MKVEKIAAYAEIISSIAIVLTLIYLGVQTQQTNSILLATSRESTLASEMEILNTAISKPEMIENLFSDSSKELTLSEYIQVGYYLSSILRIREYGWRQYNAGILDDETWESYMQILVSNLRLDKGKTFWEQESGSVAPDFAAEINRRLALEK